jgi:hypothetical protein
MRPLVLIRSVVPQAEGAPGGLVGTAGITNDSRYAALAGAGADNSSAPEQPGVRAHRARERSYRGHLAGAAALGAVIRQRVDVSVR